MPSAIQTTARPTEEFQFKAIYDQYNRLIFSRLVGHGLDHEMARELMSKTFLQAYRGREGFRGESSVKTWLIAIADRVAFNHYRDRGRLKNLGIVVSIDDQQTTESRRPLAETLEAPDPGSDPLKSLIAQEKVQLLLRALTELPPQMRQVTLLRVRDEHTYQEIADILQVSLNTVRSQLHEARRRLHEALQAHYGEVVF